jgi:hypothetical protein
MSGAYCIAARTYEGTGCRDTSDQQYDLRSLQLVSCVGKDHLADFYSVSQELMLHRSSKFADRTQKFIRVFPAIVHGPGIINVVHPGIPEMCTWLICVCRVC